MLPKGEFQWEKKMEKIGDRPRFYALIVTQFFSPVAASNFPIRLCA